MKSQAIKRLLAEGRSLNTAQRITYLPSVIAGPDDTFVVTVHHNAFGKDPDKTVTKTGVLCLHGAKSGNDPADDEDSGPVRTGKRFLKYVDPLDNGRDGTGLGPSDKGLPRHRPAERNYVFLEIDYMNTQLAGQPLQYALMSAPDGPGAFVPTAAQQIMAALVEALLDPQNDDELNDANLGEFTGGKPFKKR